VVAELKEQAAQLPNAPGVYLYKDGNGKVLYVGKAKNLRNRVRSYFNSERLLEAKTGTLIREAAAIDFIQVDNNKEALALENTLIKQYKPRFNILLRDDKTYPYIRITSETYPRVYVTRRVIKDGSQYFGPYFPGNLAWRLQDLIQRHFKVPSCRLDLSKKYSHPCLQYHIGRCHGPCAEEGLVTDSDYQAAVRDTKMFLGGKTGDLAEALRVRMERASEEMRFEEAARLRDLAKTVEELGERQKMASASDDNIDIFGVHAEPPLVAVNVFHLRSGHIVDRRSIFWEDAFEFEPAEFLTSLILQVYTAAPYVPSQVHVPMELEDSDTLEELLSEKRGRKVTLHTPQRGTRRALLELVGNNAKLSFDQRFRILKPSSAAIQEALQDALMLERAPQRIECFDISHTQGTDQVASMVVWENGAMKKSDYRKFHIKTVEGNDDFASMHEVVTRRYRRLQEEGREFPGLVLIDGGIGQLHSAARALEELGVTGQALASIAKREETLYVYGMENEPIVLDRHSPVLHLVQQIRDEAHRFAVTFHRTKRNARTLTSELGQIPGVGPKTVSSLLKEFGSLKKVSEATYGELAQVVGKAMARKVQAGLEPGGPA
jgi:excinuclease ABC subunit C